MRVSWVCRPRRVEPTTLSAENYCRSLSPYLSTGTGTSSSINMAKAQWTVAATLPQTAAHTIHAANASRVIDHKFRVLCFCVVLVLFAVVSCAAARRDQRHVRYAQWFALTEPARNGLSECTTLPCLILCRSSPFVPAAMCVDGICHPPHGRKLFRFDLVGSYKPISRG